MRCFPESPVKSDSGIPYMTTLTVVVVTLRVTTEKTWSVLSSSPTGSGREVYVPLLPWRFNMSGPPSWIGGLRSPSVNGTDRCCLPWGNPNRRPPTSRTIISLLRCLYFIFPFPVVDTTMNRRRWVCLFLPLFFRLPSTGGFLVLEKESRVQSHL